MVNAFLGIVVYVFFIYGLITFFKKSYDEAGKKLRKPNITVVVIKKELVEYLIRMLKKDFSKITLIFNDEIDEETLKIIEKLSRDVMIKFKVTKHKIN